MFKKISLLVVVVAAISIGFVAVSTQTTYAVAASEWKAGNIIDDALFTDADSMSAAQIQDFLNRMVGTGYYGRIAGQCDTNGLRISELGGGTRAQYGAAHSNPAPFTCLKDFYEVPKTVPGPGIPANNYGGKPIPAGAKSAAQLIWDAAQKYNISPKVLLVKLGTESAGPLTSDDWPFLKQYTYAMGSHCPDSGPGGSANCDSDYAGFSIQISSSAALLRYYLDNMTKPGWPYKKPYQINSIYWNIVESGCGASNVSIENMATAALYTYTPYQPNQAALNNMYGSGDCCSAYGNRNFWRTYNDWFGSTTLPVAIKSSNSPTVYIQSGGYKFAVPTMALLQDYGISSGSIKTLSDAALNAVPTPSVLSDISKSISYLVKSESNTDGDLGSIYLISVGKRYKLKDTQQMADFGFTSDQVRILPYGLIYPIDDGGQLASFISTTTNNVFKVSGGKKRIIFSEALYNSLNTSGKISNLSKSTARLITSGKPISDKPILIKKLTTAVNLYANETYYPITSMQVYSCWGFDGIQNVPLYAIADDSYVGDFGKPQSLKCMVTTNTGQGLLLNGANTYAIPSSYQISGQTLNATTSAIAKNLTVKSNLSRFIKSNNSATVWYIEKGKKRPISSYPNLLLLGYPSTPLSIIDDISISSIATGPNKLGNGQVVKDSKSQVVYSIMDNKRTAYTSAELYLAYGNKWSDIETYDKSFLDSNYPSSGSSVSRYLATDKADVNYLVDDKGCKILTSTILGSHGQSRASLPIYSASYYPRLNITNCQPLLKYVKNQSTSTVYYVENGEKRPFRSWSSLMEHSQQNVEISIISDSTLKLLPTGSTI